MMALSGVRSSWLTTARKRLLASSICAGAFARFGQRCAQRRQSRRSPAAPRSPAPMASPVVGEFEREMRIVLGRSSSADARGARSLISSLRASRALAQVRKRAEIGDAVGDMDAVEQAAAEQQPRLQAAAAAAPWPKRRAPRPPATCAAPPHRSNPRRSPAGARPLAVRARRGMSAPALQSSRDRRQARANARHWQRRRRRQHRAERGLQRQHGRRRDQSGNEAGAVAPHPARHSTSGNAASSANGDDSRRQRRSPRRSTAWQAAARRSRQSALCRMRRARSPRASRLR